MSLFNQMLKDPRFEALDNEKRRRALSLALDEDLAADPRTQSVSYEELNAAKEAYLDEFFKAPHGARRARIAPTHDLPSPDEVSVLGELGRGLEMGVRGVAQGAIGSAAMLAGEEPRERLMAGYDALSRRTQDRMITTPEFTGIPQRDEHGRLQVGETVRRAGRWAVGQAGAMTPIVGSIMAGGKAGAYTGAKVGLLGGAKGAAIGATVGAIIGSFTVGYSLYAGSLYGDITAQGGEHEEARKAALKYAAPASAVSIVLPMAAYASVAGLFGKNYIKGRLLRDAAIGASLGVPAEGMAEYLAEGWVIDGEEAVLGVHHTPEERKQRQLNAGFAGGLMGFGTGAVSKAGRPVGDVNTVVDGFYKAVVEDAPDNPTVRQFLIDHLESAADLTEDQSAMLEYLKTEQTKTSRPINREVARIQKLAIDVVNRGDNVNIQRANELLEKHNADEITADEALELTAIMANSPPAVMQRPAPRPPLDILQESLANGEISIDEVQKSREQFEELGIDPKDLDLLISEHLVNEDYTAPPAPSGPEVLVDQLNKIRSGGIVEDVETGVPGEAVRPSREVEGVTPPDARPPAVRLKSELRGKPARIPGAAVIPGVPPPTGKRADESMAVFEEARIEEERAREQAEAEEERIRRSPAYVEGLRERLQEESERSELYGLEGRVPYLKQYMEQLKGGERGRRLWLDPEYTESTRKVIGVRADLPEWFRDAQKHYGWDRNKAARAIEKGLAGAEFRPSEKGEASIWQFALDAAEQQRNEDVLRYAEEIEDNPELVSGISLDEYRLMLEVLENENIYTRPITEAAAAFRQEVESEAIAAISEELGISEEELRATLEDPAVPIAVEEAWLDMLDEDRGFLEVWEEASRSGATVETVPTEDIENIRQGRNIVEMRRRYGADLVREITKQLQKGERVDLQAAQVAATKAAEQRKVAREKAFSEEGQEEQKVPAPKVEPAPATSMSLDDAEKARTETTASIKARTGYRTSAEANAFGLEAQKRREAAEVVAASLKPGDKITLNGTDTVTVRNVLTRDGKTTLVIEDANGKALTVDSTFLLPSEFETVEGVKGEDVPRIERATTPAAEAGISVPEVAPEAPVAQPDIKAESVEEAKALEKPPAKAQSLDTLVDKAISNVKTKINSLEAKIEDWKSREYKSHGGSVVVGTDEDQGDTPWQPGKKRYDIDRLNEKRRNKKIRELQKDIEEKEEIIERLESLAGFPGKDITKDDRALLLYRELGNEVPGWGVSDKDIQRVRQEYDKKFPAFLSELSRSQKEEETTPKEDFNALEILLRDVTSKPAPVKETKAKEPWEMSLIEYAKSKLPKSQADQITSEDQVKSFKPQYLKDMQGWLDAGKQVPEAVARQLKAPEEAAKPLPVSGAFGSRAKSKEAARVVAAAQDALVEREKLGAEKLAATSEAKILSLAEAANKGDVEAMFELDSLYSDVTGGPGNAWTRLKDGGDIYAEKLLAIKRKEPKPLPQLAQEAADRSPDIFEGDNRAYISDAYDAAVEQGYAGTLEGFKSELVKAHRAGDISLASADIVKGLDAGKLDRSKATYQNAEFQYIKKTAVEEAVFDSDAIPADLTVQLKDPSVPEIGEDGKVIKDAKGRPIPGTVTENARQAHRNLSEKMDRLEQFINCL